MSRIVTNVQSILAQRVLGQNNHMLDQSLTRLSTGYRINRGADDPAGLIASENLRSEKAGITAAINNAERADQVMNIAEGGLQETSALLVQLQGLVTETANTAGMSDQEREANQLQIDSIIDSIDRIAATTNFEGVRLLDGTFDFQVSNQSLSGVIDANIFAAKNLDQTGGAVARVMVTQSARHAGFFLSLGGALDLSSASATMSFELGGPEGSREFSFSSGTTLADIASSINEFKGVLGVSAAASGNGIVLKTDEYGSDKYVTFKMSDNGGIASGNSYGLYGLSSTDEDIAGALILSTAALEGNGTSVEYGQDLAGTVNGIQAQGHGDWLSVDSDVLTAEFQLTSGAVRMSASGLIDFDAVRITGGGASFMLGGDVNMTNESTLGIRDTHARNLGKVQKSANSREWYTLIDLKNGGDADVRFGDTAKLKRAQDVVGQAISDISTLRGRIGAFQANTVEPTIRNLGVAFENTAAAESQIRETDFAKETALLTRNQILVQAATSTLAMANVQPQNVLSLLG